MESSSDHFLTGKLLIAMPGMQDPRFDRSVIFMCDHSPERAMGLIVNKPVEGLDFGELLHRYDLAPGPQAPKVPIVFGGPVELNRGFILHSADYADATNTHPVTADISLTASVEILKAISEGHGPKKCFLALGYAGWGEGQIESEIRDNGWIHCDADSDLVFASHFETVWQKALAKLGVDISGLTGSSGRA
jgi:putative transcriptional regulator